MLSRDSGTNSACSSAGTIFDPALVKAYATDYLGTQTLSQASRERIESFISHLQAAAQENRDGLVRTLNSYAPHPETKS